MSGLNAKLRASVPAKYQHGALMIEKCGERWHVYDWDYEGDGETIRTFPTARDAERWIESA